MTDTVTVSYLGEDADGEKSSFVAPYLVVAMECQRPLASAARYSLAEVEAAFLGRGAARGHERYAEGGHGVLRIDVPDTWMSTTHARLRCEPEGWFVEDAGSKNGTQVRGESTQRARLVDGDLIEAGGTLFLFRDLVRRSLTDPVDLDAAAVGGIPAALVTLSIPLRRQFEALRRVAPAAIAVLILGESGTGKELIARAVHELSGRKGPFVAVNCGAIPEHLVESELFGHRRGAFSGAAEDRLGLVRSADRGTLFLDEVAELPEPSQVALLRVLQEREVHPVGGTAPVKVDLRVVAATHQDLPARVAAGRFRQDLYARLSGFTIPLPPLRDRREDIGVLVAALLPRIAGEQAGAVSFRRSAGQALFCHPFPLNVRELENALRAAVALAQGKEIAREHLPAPVRLAPDGGDDGAGLSAEELELRDQLLGLLREHHGNVSAVGRALGKAPIQVRRWCKRFHIEVEDFRD